jgi:hypothetical protein
MSTSVVINLISGIAILAALIFLNRVTRKPVTADAAGRFHLRMNKLYSLAGILGLLMGLGLAITALFRISVIDATEIAMILTILSIFWGGGIPSLLYYYNHRVVFDDTSITVTNVFGKTVTFNWEDISSVKLNSLTSVITMNTTSGKVKIHQHLVGLSRLGDKLAEKKGWTLPQLSPGRSTPRL